MKKFIYKSLIFILISIFLLEMQALYKIYTGKYMFEIAGKIVYYTIKKSKHKSKSKVLIIGDSVGNQMFSVYEENDTINSLTCNRAIGIIGFYFLLNNYLAAGNKPEKVYLITNPNTFKYDLVNKYTFHYFLKPFYTKEYKPYFTKLAIRQVHEIPFYYLCRVPHILVSNWGPKVKRKTNFKYFISDISFEYLLKIKNICNKEKIQLIIIPGPTEISERKNINKLNKDKIFNSELSYFFRDYFENILYLPDSCFRDGVHLKHPERYRYIYKEFVNGKNPDISSSCYIQ